MRVRKITVGTYSYADEVHSFCLFQVPVFSNNIPILANFYRLIDLDVIFFRKAPGFISESKEIPPQYTKSPSHHIKDKKGNDLLSATAIAKAADSLKNTHLAELCRFNKEQIDRGMADDAFRSVSMTLNWKPPFTETMIDIDVPEEDKRYYSDFSDANASSRNDTSSMSTSAVNTGYFQQQQQQQQQESQKYRMYMQQQQQQKPLTSQPPPLPPPQQQQQKDEGGYPVYPPYSIHPNPQQQPLPPPSQQPLQQQPPPPPPSLLPQSSQPLPLSQPPPPSQPPLSSQPPSSQPPSSQPPTSNVNSNLTSSHSLHIPPQISTTNPTPQNSSAYNCPRGDLDLLVQGTESTMDMSSNDIHHKRTVSGDTLSEAQISERSDEDSSLRQETRHINKRKRQLINNTSKGSNNNPEVMEQLRTSIKMKQQKELINKQVPQSNNSSPSSRTTSPPETRSGRKRSLNSPKFRNSKNLTISTSNMDIRNNTSHSPRPISAPINQGQPNQFSSMHSMKTMGPASSTIPEYPYSSQMAPIQPQPQQQQQQPQQPLSSVGGYNEHGQMSSMSTSQPNQMHQIQTPVNNYSSQPYPALPNKMSFVSMFENLYDQIESVNRLRSTLEEQIRKSTALLQTLQASGQMIEGLVRSHFREMQVQYGEKFGTALTDLNRRLIDVEEGYRHWTNNNTEISRMKDFAGFGPMSAQPGPPPPNILTSPIDVNQQQQQQQQSQQQQHQQQQQQQQSQQHQHQPNILPQGSAPLSANNIGQMETKQQPMLIPRLNDINIKKENDMVNGRRKEETKRTRGGKAGNRFGRGRGSSTNSTSNASSNINSNVNSNNNSNANINMNPNSTVNNLNTNPNSGGKRMNDDLHGNKMINNNPLMTKGSSHSIGGMTGIVNPNNNNTNSNNNSSNINSRKDDMKQQQHHNKKMEAKENNHLLLNKKSDENKMVNVKMMMNNNGNNNNNNNRMYENLKEDDRIEKKGILEKSDLMRGNNNNSNNNNNNNNNNNMTMNNNTINSNNKNLTKPTNEPSSASQNYYNSYGIPQQQQQQSQQSQQPKTTQNDDLRKKRGSLLNMNRRTATTNSGISPSSATLNNTSNNNINNSINTTALGEEDPMKTKLIKDRGLLRMNNNNTKDGISPADDPNRNNNNEDEDIDEDDEIEDEDEGMMDMDDNDRNDDEIKNQNNTIDEMVLIQSMKNRLDADERKAS